MKSYWLGGGGGGTTQMKPVRQYFSMLPFVFQYFTNEIWHFFLEFGFVALMVVKGL